MSGHAQTTLSPAVPPSHAHPSPLARPVLIVGLHRPILIACARSLNPFPLCCRADPPRRARCGDGQLYDEPPCTDYAELAPLHAGRWLGAPYAMPTNISSSPAELFQTAAGLPLLLTLAVLALHATCYALQLACGGSEDVDAASDDVRTPRDLMRESIARGGVRAEQAPLLPTKDL